MATARQNQFRPATEEAQTADNASQEAAPWGPTTDRASAIGCALSVQPLQRQDATRPRLLPAGSVVQNHGRNSEC